MDIDHFGTLAEMGVALAGFSAISAALSYGRQELAPLDRFRTILLLVCALGASLTCTVPIIGSSYSLAPNTIWITSSSVLFIYMCTVNVVMFLMLRALSSADRSKLSKLVLYLGVGGNLMVIVLQACNILGVLGSTSPGPLVVSIVWLLFMASILFVRILVSRPAGVPS